MTKRNYFLTDTHTHLYLDVFKNDIHEVISRSIDNGVSKFYLPNIDEKTLEPLLQLCSKYPQHCFPMIGLHPSSVDKGFEKQLKVIENYLKKEKFFAIGEIGIDLFHDNTFLNEQIEVFQFQIKLSLEYKLPVVIHCRNSFGYIIEILEKITNNEKNLMKKLPFGIFHCFSGNKDEAETVLNLRNFYFGIGGLVTFKNAKLDETLKSINLDKIVLETDSPYLTPEPHRGKRNESSYLIYIAEKIAIIKNLSIEEVASVTSQNAMSIFGVQERKQ